jgi:predicted nucleotide-binding protein (sugar kinase/HSP70/actin superfamily)
MMKPLRDRNPDMNIVAIDYDAGASRVNQENRIKLMLANAREQLSDETNKADITETTHEPIDINS